MQREVLRSHLVYLRSLKANSAYFEYLIYRILPLIQLLNPSVIGQWVEEKKKYLIDLEVLAREALNEINDTSQNIKTFLNSESLSKLPQIKEMCDLLESVLEEKELYVMPAQYEVAFERLKFLVGIIVEIGREDLVREYIKSLGESKKYIQNTNKIESYQCNNCRKRFICSIDSSAQDILLPICSGCGGTLLEVFSMDLVTMKFVEFYDETKFVPSYFKLLDLNKFFDSPAGAWEQLYAICWYWNDRNRDYFRKKLHYTDAQECSRARRLLNLNNMRIEVNKIKRESSVNCRLIKRHQIDKILDTVLTALYPGLNENTTTDFCVPEELSLVFVDDVKLVLRVKWTEGINEGCLLHTFHSDEDPRYIFFKKIIQYPGKFILLNDHGYDARKYLREAKIIDPIADLFLAKFNGDGVALKSNKILLYNTPVSKRKKICKFVQALKHIKWS
jgi:hypothetical protein